MHIRSIKIHLLAFILFSSFLINPVAFGRTKSQTAQPERRPTTTDDSTSQLIARVYFSDTDDLNQLAARLDVWEVDHARGYLDALLIPEQVASLQADGYRVVVDAESSAALAVQHTPLPGQTSGIPGYACYRTVEETYASLASLAADHPDLANWLDIGDSWEKDSPDGEPGYDLQALVLTNQSTPGPKANFVLMGAIHAREYATAELATRFAELLVDQYGTDPDVTWLLDHSSVHILPLANPDGRKHAESGEYWRKNTNPQGCISSWNWGTDLNRNSSFMWGGVGASPFGCNETYHGESAASEPETQAIQNYLASVFPDQRGPSDSDAAPTNANGLFITLHSYAPLVLFPWGWQPDPTPNHTQLETLGRKFGFFNQYPVCQSGEPGCIYATSGSSDDWAYGELGVAAYTFEIGTEFFQACSVFETEIIAGNIPALLYAFKAARFPYQTPAGPETLQVVTSIDEVPPGTPVTITAHADDTRYASNGWGEEPVQPIAAARFSLDSPSWKEGVQTYPLEPVDGEFNSSKEDLTAILDTTGWAPGRHTVFVESQDAAGNWGVPSTVFLTVAFEPSAYLPMIFKASTGE